MALTKSSEYVGFPINEYVKIKTFIVSDYLNNDNVKKYKAEIITNHFTDNNKLYQIATKQVNVGELDIEQISFVGLYSAIKSQEYTDWSDC